MPVREEYDRWLVDYLKAKQESVRSEKDRRYQAEHPDYPDSIFTIFIPTDEKIGKNKCMMQVSFKPMSIL